MSTQTPIAGSSPAPRPDRKAEDLLAYALIGLFLLLFFAAAVTGPDFDHYLRWARAFESADTAAFWDKGQTLSPLGVPLSQWSHGPGLIFAALCPAGCRPFMSLDRQGMIAGMLFTAALWWAMLRLLRRAGAGDLQWAIYGVALAMLGTHLGFYSRSYASETFSLASLALLAMWTVTRPAWRKLDALVVGCLAGLLIISRSQLGIYTLPFLGVMAWSVWQSRRGQGASQPALLAALTMAPMAVALAEVLLTNRWMTGSAWGSPYAFGDATFRSLDFARPEFGAVLLHPWHGLLTHHPLYLVGFAALAALIVTPRARSERLFWLSCAIVIVLHVYLQAAWYVWWLGMQTFGMRGLGAAAVILTPALVYLMRERELRGARYTVWAALALACCLWSASLFRENLYAETQFLTYAGFFGETARLFLPLLAPLALAVLIAAGAALWAQRGERVDPGSRRGRFRTQVQVRPALTLSLLLLIPLALYCLTEYVAARRLDATAARAVALVMAATGGGFTALLLARTAGPAAPAASRSQPGRGLVEWAVALGTATLFTVATLLFIRLAVQTERMIATRAWPTAGLRYVSAVHVDEVAESYLEYLTVAGFEAKKSALRDYVETLLACAAVAGPEQALPRLLGRPDVTTVMQAPFGDDLRLTRVGLAGGEGTRFVAGADLGVETRWRIIRPTAPRKFSLRLVDTAGQRLAAADYPPQLGCGDGETWQPAAAAMDRGALTIPADLAPGPYTVQLVVYDPETLAPLPVGEAFEATLATIEVTDGR